MNDSCPKENLQQVLTVLLFSHRFNNNSMMKVDFLPDKQSSLSFVSVSVGFFQKVLAILF